MLILGYMDPDRFLGGSIRLDRDGAERVFREAVADPLGRGVEDAAIGIYEIAAAQITDLIRRITVERGLDPRDFVLHAFGGSCGMLAGSFGQELRVRRVVIPYTASVNCAFGLVSADVKHEFSTTETLPADADPADLDRVFAPLEARARAQLREEGFAADHIRVERAVDLRYTRQVHEVTTPLRVEGTVDATHLAQLVGDFEALYEKRYGKGSAYREAGVEMTVFRLTASGVLKRPPIPDEEEGPADAAAARTGTRRIYAGTEAGMAEGRIYDFAKLRPGHELVGPAVIHTPITTIAVPDGQRARIDRLRNVVLEFER